jgi:hypothetical protein
MDTQTIYVFDLAAEQSVGWTTLSSIDEIQEQA